MANRDQFESNLQLKNKKSMVYVLKASSSSLAIDAKMSAVAVQKQDGKHEIFA